MNRKELERIGRVLNSNPEGHNQYTGSITKQLHHSEKEKSSWMAEISGTDPKFGLKREFLTPVVQKLVYGRVAHRYEITKPGLYEAGNDTTADKCRSGHCVVFAQDGKLVHGSIDKARATAIAKLMDAGHDLEAARIMTKPTPQK